MAIVAGIDEAGYGPVLGPLVVTGTAFELPDDLAQVSLWKTLRTSVSQRVSAKGRRLPIADSKKLYSPAAGLSQLERTALVMLRTSEWRAPTFRGLLQMLAPHAQDSLAAYPWYTGFDPALPSACTDADVGTRANAVRRDMQARGVRLAGVYGEPLLEGQFNHMVSSTKNKATVSLGLVWRIVQRILSMADGQAVHVHVDRQGGRAFYGAQLMASFGRYHLRIVEESELRSAYELVDGPRTHTVDFLVGGEDRHLPVALASVYSKYLRELFMSGFNAWWAGKVNGLRPTAGYYGDGWRFLRDIAPAIQQLGIDREWLVRSR